MVTGVVDAALDLPPDARRAFLVRECGDDAALLDSAEALLAACDRAERASGFLDGAAGEWIEPVLAQLAAYLVTEDRAVPTALDRALAGRYALERVLGHGGMAVVYLAHDTALGRRVALKVLKPDLALALGHERFMREIRTVARLAHPHVVPLLETGEAAGTVYFTMPFVAGESLREKLDREPQLPVDDALRIAAQVADALDCAHRHNVVHRDIKPDNILLEEGHAVVADFGVACAIARAGGEALEEKLTATGVVFGTPSYMSPEQASGERTIDGRSDVYSLGAVLYEMLAGEPPYRAPSVASLITKILSFPVPSLQIDRPGVPDEIDRLVQRCLAKAPADRFQTAGELREALRGVSRILTANGAGHGAAAVSAVQAEFDQAVAPGPAQAVGRASAGPRTTAMPTARPPVWPRRRRAVVMGGLIALVMLAAMAWTSSRRRPNGFAAAATVGTTSALRVAVFPFAVSAAGNDANYLGEAAMDLLSGAIDGVGELRRVDPRALMSRLRRETTIDMTDVAPPDARRISGEFGARRFILGAATVLGDRVHLTAALYDMSRGDAPVSTEVREGMVENLSMLVTEVARGLFAAQTVGTGGRLASMEAVRAANHDAERSYLEGEALLRRGVTDSAAAAFRQALASDSTFALAWYRLSHAEDFNGPRRAEFMMRSIDAAMRHRDRLAPRDRMLMEAHHAFTHGDGALAERRALQVVGEYPDQVEGWWLVGVTRLWHAWQWGRSPMEARGPLERALQLDPDHPAALYQSAWVAGFSRQWATADSLLPRMTSLGGMFHWSSIRSRVISAWDHQDESEQSALLEELSDNRDSDISVVAVSMALYTDHLDGARRVAYLLTDPSRRSQAARARGHLLAALARASAGQRAAASAEFEHMAPHDPSLALAYLAWVTAIPALRASDGALDSLRIQLERWEPPAGSAPSSYWIGMPPGLYPFVKDYLLGLVHARLGHQAAAYSHASRLEAARVAADSAGLLPDLAREIRALAAMHDGHGAAALRILEGASMRISWHYEVTSPLHRRPLGRFLRAELLYAAGREREALGWFDSFGSITGPEFIFLAPAYRRQAQIHEQLGNRAEAIDYYTRFIARWKDADADLQPEVDDARRRLARLTSVRSSPRPPVSGNG